MLPKENSLSPQPNIHTTRSYPQLPHGHRDYSVEGANVAVNGRASQGHLPHSGGLDGTQNLGFIPAGSVSQDRRASGYEETMLWMLMNSRSPDFIRTTLRRSHRYRLSRTFLLHHPL